ncbi:MAG: polyprenyl diphosphate synthase [Nitrososphaeria archaeon]|nr:polyprenyl diphosphate synthase [Conexivisphaerales archaeon]
MRLDSVLRKIIKIVGIEAFYERMLEQEVKEGPIPNHIAVIMDGNRRWANERSLPTWEGYRYGAEIAEKFVLWSLDYKVKIITFYALSKDNLFKRSPQELSSIIENMYSKLEKLDESGLIEKYKIRIKTLGNKELLPDTLRNKIEELEKKTKENEGMVINIAVAYSGRHEILNAVKEIAKDVSEGKIKADNIDEGVFMSKLYTGDLPYPEPDVIIRTSGEMRLSDFLLYQSSYSEMIFMDIYWPDVRKIDFLRILRTYEKRNRRFGK